MGPGAACGIEQCEVGSAVGASARTATSRPLPATPDTGTDAPMTHEPPATRPAGLQRWIGGLDGLRAVAVIAVVLFHLNPGYLSGGFLGVDLFFVISGYLITRLLLAERQRTGRIRLGRFYLRRARRLLPALAALLAVVVCFGALLWPDQRPTLTGSAVSSLGYVTNWWLIADQQSYFVTMGRPPMLQHLWSLAIEEQYYLLWAPAVIAASAAWLWRRRPAPAWRMPMLVAWIAGGLALASTAAMAFVAIATNVPYQADSSRVYFGTDTHAMGLLLGSAVGALATVPWRSVTRRPPRWVRPAWRATWQPRALLPAWIAGDAARGPLGRWATDTLAVAGLAGVTWFFVSADEYVPWLYRGGFLAFAAVAGVAVCCAARPGSWVGRALDAQPLAWVGRRSYGIYLWHWPVFVVTRPLIDVQGPAWLVDCARTGLAVALAAVSYRYLETPVRTGTFLASLRRAWAAWCELAARRGSGRDYDGDRLPAGQRRLARHGLLPALAVVCVAVLVSAHLTAVQQPVWAASMPDTALPIPGVVPDLPGGVSGRPTARGAPAAPDSTAGRAGRTAATSPSRPASAAGAGTTATRPPAVTESPADDAPAGAVSAGAVADGAIGDGPTEGTTTGATDAATAEPTSGAKTATQGTSSPGGPAPGSATAAGTVTSKAPARTTTAAPAAPSTPAKAPVTTVATTPASKVAAPAASSVKLSAFGDSVLLGASKAVRAVVGSMSLDAVVGRQAWDTLADVTAAHQAKKLAAVVLIHTGNNGVISPQQLASTLAGLKDRRRVVLVNDHVDRAWQGPNNKAISAVNGKYPNVVILDWNAAASKNPGWFGPDGIHVNGAGAKAYASLVAAAIG